MQCERVTSTRPRRRHKRVAGQALIETALSLGILLLLVLGLANVAQWVGVHYAVQQAARVAASHAALAGGDAGPGHGARQLADDLLDGGFGTRASAATIAITCPGKDDPATAGACLRYDPITVTITYRDAFWVPLPGVDGIVVRHSATRMSEQDGQP